MIYIRAVARSENPGGGHVVLGGDNVPPLVEIGLADLPKSGGARDPPAPPLATGLYCAYDLLIWMIGMNHNFIHTYLRFYFICSIM